MNVFYAVFILFACSLFPGLSGIRLVKVVMPSYKMRGESVLLECKYELDLIRNHKHEHFHHHNKKTGQRGYWGSHDGPNEPEMVPEELYAVKWFKDREEFYRYCPSATPTKKSYRVDGVRVVDEHSDNYKVLLRGLTLNATGHYKCIAQAEAPNFSSAVAETHMDVVYLPRDGPHVRGKEDQYQIGDTMSLNCSSGKSHPASHLQWIINNDIVPSSSLIHYNNTVHRHGLITSTLGLYMEIEPRHFDNGVMRVKCLAIMSPTLWQGNKENALQRKPVILDSRESVLLVGNSSSYPSRQINLLFVSSFILILYQLVLSHMI